MPARAGGVRRRRARRRRATTYVRRGRGGPGRAGRRAAAGGEPGHAAQHRRGDARRLLDGPRPDDAVGAADAQGRRELPALLRHRLAVLRVALELLHRAVPPPDRRAHQHVQPGHLDARRLAGLRHPRQPRARLQRAAPAGRLHDRLRRQVPQRVRVGARPGAAAGGAGLVDLQHRLRLGLRRLGLRQHVRGRPAGCRSRSTRRPRRARATSREGPGLRRHRDRRPGDGLPGPRARPRTRPTSSRSRSTRPHNRTQPEGYYPGDPLFPPMFRDREGERSCGRVACSKLTVDDLPGLRRRARRQPSRGPRRARRRAPGTPAARCRPPRRCATCATARGWPSPPTGW